MNISKVLKRWYDLNHRSLPWRETTDPYKIWLSEIILQQTRVEQGLPYYQQFTTLFPTVKSLANAPEKLILKTWQGLGYYSRARNLHHAAKMVVEEFNGRFPADYQQLKSLKGVGDYTAAAIASFAFNLPHAVVDGNVYRFLSRYYGIDIPVDSPEGKKFFALKAEEILDRKSPAAHNQSIMEFGALQCKPAAPNCSVCPLCNSCMAFKSDSVSQLPVKSKKLKVTKRYFNYLMVNHSGKLFLNHRGAGDIWQHLYDLPVIETPGPVSTNKLLKSDEWRDLFNGYDIHIKDVSEEVVHKLSHQHIHVRFFNISINRSPEGKTWKQFIKVKSQTIDSYPVPKLVENYFREQDLIYK